MLITRAPRGPQTWFWVHSIWNSAVEKMGYVPWLVDPKQVKQKLCAGYGPQQSQKYKKTKKLKCAGRGPKTSETQKTMFRIRAQQSKTKKQCSGYVSQKYKSRHLHKRRRTHRPALVVGVAVAAVVVAVVAAVAVVTAAARAYGEGRRRHHHCGHPHHHHRHHRMLVCVCVCRGVSRIWVKQIHKSNKDQTNPKKQFILFDG